MADSELHMLGYWIADKGIETAFEEYYPNLAKNDPTIAHCLQQLRLAVGGIHARVTVLMAEAPEPDPND